MVYVYRLDTSLVNLAVTGTNAGHALELRRRYITGTPGLDWTELGRPGVCLLASARRVMPAVLPPRPRPRYPPSVRHHPHHHQ